jgi:hypothetical protein
MKKDLQYYIEKESREMAKRKEYNERRRVEFIIYRDKAVKQGIKVTEAEIDAYIAKK